MSERLFGLCRKKGFTLVELLVVIVIMSILLLIAVPVYLGITDSVNRKVYESKYQELLSKSELYAEENGRNVFDIKELIENGVIEADNELGEYKDPRDDRDMSCDVMNAVLKNDGYEVTITENKDRCYSREELENLYGMVRIKLLDENKNPITKLAGTDWLRKNKVFVTYEFRDAYKEYQSFLDGILWYGDRELSCSKDNLGNCKYYEINSDLLLNAMIHFQATVNIGGIIIQNEANLGVLLDNERPKVVEGSIVANNEYNTQNARKVEFELTDQSGSGVASYAIVKEQAGRFTCIGASYKNASEGVQTEYLDNGTYSICVKDKVGNTTSEEEVNDGRNRFVVDKVNKVGPTFGPGGVKIQTTATGYNNLEPIVTIDVKNSEGNQNGLKMCISLTGFLKDCTWENFLPSKKVKIGEHNVNNYDGSNKTVYVSIQDSYGNVSNRSGTYKIYKKCDQKTSFAEVSNTSSSCPKCGTANYNSNLQNKDKYFNVVCDKKTESVKCNIPSNCCEKTKNFYGEWSSCNVTCGTGYQRRDVYHRSVYDNRLCWTDVNGSSKKCEMPPCDTTPPTIKFDPVDYTTGYNGWYGAMSLKITASDLSGIRSLIYCRTSESTCTPQYGKTLENNSYKVELWHDANAIKICAEATDKLGNKSKVICSDAYKVDKVTPSWKNSWENSNLTNGWYKKITAIIEGIDSDSGIYGIKYCFTTESRCTPTLNATMNGVKGSIPFSSNKNSQTICWKSVDNAKNESTVGCVDSIKVDGDAPIAKMVLTAGVGSIKVDASLSNDAHSGIKTYYYSKNSGRTWVSSTSSIYEFTNVAYIPYTIQVKVEDQAGNMSEIVSGNIQPIHPVDALDPNNYESCKKVLCSKSYFNKLVSAEYIAKFKKGLDYQPFRNALFDCSKVTTDGIRGSSDALKAINNHSRTTVAIVSGKANTTCTSKQPSNCNSDEKEDQCYGWDHYTNMMNNVYTGKAFVISAAANGKPCSGGKCGDKYANADMDSYSCYYHDKGCPDSGNSWTYTGHIIAGEINGDNWSEASWRYPKNDYFDWRLGDNAYLLDFLNGFGMVAMKEYDVSSNKESSCYSESRYLWTTIQVAVRYFKI